MAHTYDEQVQLLDLQAKSGRLTVAQAKDAAEIVMSAEVDHLEKMAGTFWQDRELSQSFRDKATERRETIPDRLRKIGGTAPERLTLQKAVSPPPFDSEKWAANAALHRPIGMPAPATAAPSTTRLGSAPDNRPVWPNKPESQMTNEQRAAHYGRLFRQAPTPADARYYSELSQKFAQAAREEG